MKRIDFLLLSFAMIFSTQTIFVCAQTTAVKANDFLNSIGACTHISQGADNPTNVSAALLYCGIRNIRDDGSTNSSKLQKFIDVHNATGAKVSLLSINGNIAASISEYEKLAAAGALLAAEGPNEPNNWHVTYNGQTSSSTTSMPIAEFCRDLYTAVKASPILAGIPVFASSEAGGSEPDNCGLQFLTIPSGANCLMPDGTVYGDYANVHNYICNPGHLVDNNAWLAESPGTDRIVDGLYNEYGRTWWSPGYNGYTITQLLTLPRVTTETGWTTQGDKSLTEDQQGRLFLNLYLAAYKRGWTYTFVYMLHDDAGQGYWGFVHTDYSNKPSATYLHNMTTILSDNASSFTPGSVNYTIPSQPATVHDMLIQKSNGVFELAVWSEKASGTNNITVNLGATYATVNVYDPTVGTDPVQNLNNVSSIPLTLSDHPVILELNPIATSVKNVNKEKLTLAAVYPNPVDDFMYVESSEDLNKVELFDLTGKAVLRLSHVAAGKTTLNVASLAKGSYLLRLTDGKNKMENHKIMKM